MGAPAFRVDGKIFAQLSTDERVVLLKVELGEQQALLATQPEHVWLPAHWGKFGWTYLRIERFAANDVGKLVEYSWLSIAPKRLAAQWSSGRFGECAGKADQLDQCTLSCYCWTDGGSQV